MGYKVKVNVSFNTHTKQFFIPVGEGDKTWKWLALVSAQRFTLQSPHGILRSREKRLITGTNVQLIPNELYTTSPKKDTNGNLLYDANGESLKEVTNKFYHPEHLICDSGGECLNGDHEVNVELINKVGVNQVGAPQFARWAFVAFNVSEEKAETRAKMIHDAANEIEEHRLMLEQMAKEKELREAAMKIFEMRQKMKDQLQDEQRNEELMLEEWGHMTHGMTLERVVPNMKEQVKIRKFFVENYEPFAEVFKHVAAVGADAGGTATISFMEFSSFLKESKIIEGTNMNDEIQRIFIESHVHDAETQGQVTLQSEMHQHEFFIGIIAVAVFIKIRMKKGGRSSIARARGARGKTVTHSDALKEVYNERFVPYIEKNLFGPAIKAALGTEEVLLLYQQHDEELTFIYNMYRDRFESNLKRKRGMVEEEFENVIKDARNKDGSKLLTDKAERRAVHELTSKEVRQAFGQAQHDSIADADEMRAVEEGGRNKHREYMTYSEFLEAIARIGAAKWEGDIDGGGDGGGSKKLKPMGLFVKIQMAIEAVCRVLAMDKNKQFGR
mmetsp:Transcript_9988/g.20389  ORF Transcript_9988/g.20389 Transcript_9988/m.20389 type:complete len:557 (+) Transcript_9988:97-1767(+)|eukprot:CAMPEP_0118645008 /NCGR_PEP_ID=MMETSP0785-20121206/7264_1 /TAXON_ID=91992 /ORGANISM="Bolidomonas pacifica, Strain CCMP 1866" /LENGTH=556 /DNA_ID=CAMNT_0006536847 /DNA_START=10 /DNA_END=1680 /DNA_ORIENTATION=+